MKEETIEKWKERIEEAEMSGMGVREWCGKKGISYASIRVFKHRLEKAGYLKVARKEEVDGQARLTYRQDQWPYAVHYLLQEQKRVSYEGMYERIQQTMGRGPQEGEVYVTRGKDRRVQHLFLKVGSGYAMVRLYGTQRLPFPRGKIEEGEVSCEQRHLQKIWEQVSGQGKERRKQGEEKR